MDFLTDITCSGLFAGLSLEGTVLIERKDANSDFYGSAVPARDILGGRVPPPEVAGKMYEVRLRASFPIALPFPISHQSRT
jgi:lipid-binding SYLF domain-containing protein